MFYIGNVKVKGQVIAAPQAGIANLSWRLFVKKFGAALVYSEMISIDGFNYKNRRTIKMLETSKKEKPVALQIFGNDVQKFVAMAKYIDKNTDADIIDINVGCPVDKVAKKSKSGSALLNDLDKLEKIIKGIVSNISKPLTIKIRVGWDDENLNYLEVAKMAESAGVSAIAVHARTRAQMYKGKSNWNYIKEIKEIVSIPVIGNGDVFTPEDAKRMLDQTKCDAVMIARGTHGNPWLFKQINSYLKNGKYKVPNKKEKIKILLYQTRKLIKFKNEEIALKEIRQFLPNYLNKIKNSKKILGNMSEIQTYKQLKSKLKILR